MVEFCVNLGGSANRIFDSLDMLCETKRGA